MCGVHQWRCSLSIVLFCYGCTFVCLFFLHTMMIYSFIRYIHANFILFVCFIFHLQFIYRVLVVDCHKWVQLLIRHVAKTHPMHANDTHVNSSTHFVVLNCGLFKVISLDINTFFVYRHVLLFNVLISNVPKKELIILSCIKIGVGGIFDLDIV